MLKQLKRPIPDIQIPTEPQAPGHSSNSLSEALVDTTSDTAPQIVAHQPTPVAQPLGNNVAAQPKGPDPLPQVQTPQPRGPKPAAVPRTGETGGVPTGVVPTNPHLLAIAYHDVSATPNTYQPMDYRQVTEGKFSNVIPNMVAGVGGQPQAPVLVPLHEAEAFPSTLSKPPPVMVRLPRDPDRPRLAKDILKQLGKPIGTVPAVLTRHEHKKRKKAGADTQGASTNAQNVSTDTQGALAQPSTEAAVDRVSNYDNLPLLPEVVPASGQAASAALPPSPPQENPLNELPPLGYPDQREEITPHDVIDIEQDVEMDNQPSANPSEPLPLSQPPQEDPIPPSVNPGPTLSEDVSTEGPVQSSKLRGPPPGTEIIEISDEEEQPAADAVTAIIQPMEVDGEVRKGGQSPELSQLPPEKDNVTVAVEMGDEPTVEPLDHRPSQEPVASKNTQSAEKKSRKLQPYVQLPPRPNYMSTRKDKERAPAQGDDEEGWYNVAVRVALFLTSYPCKSRTSSCGRAGLF